MTLISGRLKTYARRLVITPTSAECMSSRYKVRDDAYPHFVTFTVLNWIDALSRPMYKDIVCNSLQFCQKEKGLKLHAWVIMSNHVPLIISADIGFKLSDIVRDIKKFTSNKIIDAIANNTHESRKDWMLKMFATAGKENNSNKEFQFWQQDYHPIELSRHELLIQRLNYLHENPVKAGIVWEAAQYRYSSAIDYCGSEGLLPIEMLEVW